MRGSKARTNVLRGVAVIVVGLAAFEAGRMSTAAHPFLPTGTASVQGAPTDFERNDLAGGYGFINPLLSCDPILPANLPGLPQAEPSVRAVLDDARLKGDISTASVYVRDLDRGPWFGVNHSERFIPASLLKVPLLISYFRLAQSNPGLPEQSLRFQGDAPVAQQSFVEAEPLEVGKEYRVGELLERMITTSDNEAMHLLLHDRTLLPEDSLVGVYRSLGVASPADMAAYELTVADYAKFFRVLYNSTYLTPERSQRALELLSRSEFALGLRRGIPAGVPVAHKFGERHFVSTGERQLHDCGIVYEPDRPYLLCVMTRGRELERMAAVIAEVSRVVYQYVRDMP